MSDRALIFLCDNTFLWVPFYFTLWTWPCSFKLLLLCLRDRRSVANCFCPLWFVILSSSENLTLLITFEQYVLELWYFTWVIIVTRPFRTYQYFFTLWPWPWSLTYFKKNFLYNFWTVSARALLFITSTLVTRPFSFFTLWPWPCSITLILKRLILLIIFEQWGLELWYFTRVIILTRPFYGYQQFWSMALTYKDGLLFENLNLVYNFWTVKVRAVRFHMNIPYDKV